MTALERSTRLTVTETVERREADREPKVQVTTTWRCGLSNPPVLPEYRSWVTGNARKSWLPLSLIVKDQPKYNGGMERVVELQGAFQKKDGTLAQQPAKVSWGGYGSPGPIPDWVQPLVAELTEES